MKEVKVNKSKGASFTLFCPECRRTTPHTVLQSVDMNGHDDYEHGFWIEWEDKYQIVECQCSFVSFVREHWDSENCDPDGDPIPKKIAYPIRSPHFLVGKDFRALPPSIASIYSETIEAYNSGLLALCAGGVRAIIEGVCGDRRVKRGPITIKKKDGTRKIEQRKTLEAKISGLHEKGILTSKGASMLHAHRWLGNEALHELVRPTRDELKLAIGIIEHILENIYELPLQAAELKLKTRMRKKRSKA